MGMWAGDRANGSVIVPLTTQGTSPSVIKANNKIGFELDLPACSNDNPNNVACPIPRRHEVDQHGRAGIRFENGLQNQCIGAITAGDARFFSFGRIDQRPFSGVPSSAAKQADESKRGKQSQSMDPSRETRAAASQSPINA